MVRRVRRRNKKEKQASYVANVTIILYIAHHYNVRNVTNFQTKLFTILYPAPNQFVFTNVTGFWKTVQDVTFFKIEYNPLKKHVIYLFILLSNLSLYSALPQVN